MASISASQWKALADGLGSASATVLRLFLKYENLAIGNPTKDQLVARIQVYVADGSLDLTRVLSLLRGVQENKNKRVYCYTVGKEDRKKLKSNLTGPVGSLAEATIKKGTRDGQVSYSYVSDEAIRISFAEMQEDVEVDLREGTIATHNVTKVIVSNLDLTDWWVTISYDPAARLHARVTPFGYYEHYRQLTETMLGVPLRSIDLGDALEALQKSPLVRPRHMVVDTDDGPVQITGESGDCRRMGVTPGVEKFVVGRERGYYEWLTTAEAGAQKAHFGGYSGTIPLIRTIPTEINAHPGIVRFSRDSLPVEVDYVLSRIKEIA